MPEISRFFGIVIAIYYKEHGVAHFHAKYGGQTGVFSVVDLKLIEGRLPKRVIALVLEWAFEHRRELTDNWERAVAHQPLQPIAPLE
ncbi:MAG: transcriptional regulator [Acidobacteria bacterium]|nr:MAG: transcriptional regulator [Acidobacteriota bacterium]